MTDKPENPPAFPCTGEGYQSEKYTQYGMTLRDWFAGQAMFAAWNNIQCVETGDYLDMATEAYAMADAMLEARKHGRGEG